MPKIFWSLLVVSAAAVSVAGCNKTPADKAADAIARSGHDRSKAIQSQADNQAKGLDQRATTLSGQAGWRLHGPAPERPGGRLGPGG